MEVQYTSVTKIIYSIYQLRKIDFLNIKNVWFFWFACVYNYYLKRHSDQYLLITRNIKVILQWQQYSLGIILYLGSKCQRPEYMYV